MNRIFCFAKKIGIKLSLDHHSQAFLIVALVFFLIIKAWWSIPGVVLYGIMHFQYGGGGTFQKPPRDDQRQATIADLFYVIIGVVGIAVMAIGLGMRII